MLELLLHFYRASLVCNFLKYAEFIDATHTWLFIDIFIHGFPLPLFLNCSFIHAVVFRLIEHTWCSLRLKPHILAVSAIKIFLFIIIQGIWLLWNIHREKQVVLSFTCLKNWWVIMKHNHLVLKSSNWTLTWISSTFSLHVEIIGTI